MNRGELKQICNLTKALFTPTIRIGKYFKIRRDRFEKANTLFVAGDGAFIVILYGQFFEVQHNIVRWDCQ